MAGIAGFWRPKGGIDRDALAQRARALAGAIHPRGPDAESVWTDADVGTAFVHSHLDIRRDGAPSPQPFAPADNRAATCADASLLNAAELRRELEAVQSEPFSSGDDAEAIHRGCLAWGAEALAERLEGAFAFAFWNGREKRLFLVRDRLGVRPLYWSFRDGTLLFASSVGAFAAYARAAGLPSPEIDRDALGALMRYMYIPAPLSIYRGVGKLEPGRFLEIAAARGEPVVSQYGDPRAALREGVRNRLAVDTEGVPEELETILLDGVRRRLVPGVETGALLSGGIDSSLVTALLQSVSGRPARTFSIGFEEQEFNEAPYAKAVARHLGTCHTEHYFQPREVWETIPRLPLFYDEPFADSSQLPSCLVCRLARDSVSSAMTGDGGDELFAGYTRYHHPLANLPRMKPWKSALFRRGVKLLPPGCWDRLARFVPVRLLPPAHRRGFGRELYDRVGRFRPDVIDNYREQMSIWTNPGELVPGSNDFPGVYGDRSVMDDSPEPMDWMQYLDLIGYLPDDGGVKMDRAGLSAGLEIQSPLVDRRVLEFAWRLPPKLRTRNRQPKWPLRQVLFKYVPPELIDRPKLGFCVPLPNWLRGPMREWAEAQLNPSRLAREGWFNPSVAGDAWRRFLAGENLHHHIWCLLSFQTWLERPCPAPRNLLGPVESFL